MLESLLLFWHKKKLKRLKAKGLQIADDCRLMDMPDFGSEPYLVSIGNHVTITSKVTFITHDGATFVFRNLPQYKKVISYGRITIRDNCFIGYGVIILPGVTIGPNSIVAAGAIVTQDVPPNTVSAGVPARAICTTEEYAQKKLNETPDYDAEDYKSDKKKVLLGLYPYPWSYHSK